MLGGDVPGEVSGTLQFSGGNFDGAVFQTAGNEVLTATGRVSGSAATVRLTDQSGNVWVLVGAADQAIPTCAGRVDGLFTGPLPGDIGDWHGTLRSVAGAGADPNAAAAATSATATDAASSGSPGEACTNPAHPCTDAVPCCFGLTCLNGNCRVLLGQSCSEYFPLPDPLTESELCEDTQGDAFCFGVCVPMEADEPSDPPAPPSCSETGASCEVAECCVGYCNQDFTCECVGMGETCAGIGTGGCCSGQPCAGGTCP
jgi:hypothetical protein